MGLGPGDISVPSLLAKSGLIPHSFSFCYDKSYSGRLYFGDQGPASQRSTSFLPLKGYRYVMAFLVPFNFRISCYHIHFMHLLLHDMPV